MEENKNWWDSNWYKEWTNLAKNRKKDFSFPEGHWGCYIDEDGELIYEYKIWNDTSN